MQKTQKQIEMMEYRIQILVNALEEEERKKK